MIAESQVRVRFAPSPSGHLHIGGARTALFNWLYARKTGGVFVLRIEDTDAARSTEESYRAILDAMEWLGLDWDEGPGKGGPYGPYTQSARQVLYHTEVQKLVAVRAAYHCFCTPDELEEMRKEAQEQGKPPKYDRRCRNLPEEEVGARLAKRVPHVIRFRMPEGETKVFDVIRGPITFRNDDLDDFVLIRSNGKPTYNFAAAVDDARMKITHIIRGDDHLSNTPKQVLLYRALEYPLPKFAHLPMILGSDRTRLSKRHGATSVQEFRRLGYLPDSMVNYLALLGWSFDGSTEYFPRSALIKKFSLKRVSKNPAAYDMDKLSHIDGEHFKNLPAMKRVGLVIEKLEAADVLPADFDVTEWNNGASEGNGGRRAAAANSRFASEVPRLAIILKAMGNRLRNLKDAPEMLAYFFKDEFPRDAEAYAKYLGNGDAASVMSKLADTIARVTPFDRGEIERAVRGLADELGLGAGDLIHPCRVALTGKSVSPDIFSVIQLLGRDKCVERLERAGQRY